MMQRQVLVIENASRTADVPLLQYSDTTVDVAGVKDAETTGTARGLHDEVQRNPDGQQAAFSIAHDREQGAAFLRQWKSERLGFHRAERHRGDSQRSQRRNEDQMILAREPVTIPKNTST